MKATHFAVQILESKQKSYSCAKPKFDNNSNHIKKTTWQLNKKLSAEEVDFGVGRKLEALHSRLMAETSTYPKKQISLKCLNKNSHIITFVLLWMRTLKIDAVKTATSSNHHYK